MDSFLAYNRADGLLGDAARTLCTKWPFDIASIQCPVFLYHGEGDYDMATAAPYAPNWLAKTIPNCKMELVPATGHVCVFGPTELTREQITRAITAMK